MKDALRHLIPFAIICLMLTIFVMQLLAVGFADSHKLCEKLDVQLPGNLEFVSEEDVRGYLDKNYGVYIGRKLDSLELGKIESLLLKKNVVEDAQAWTTRDGVLHVSVTQRPPAIRFARGDEGFYMDREGNVFPLHPNYTADVPVIEGAIPPLENGENAEWGKNVLKLMDYISQSRVWNGRIDHESVNKNGDIELSPVEGKEKFILGEPRDIESKFERMGKYYTHILPSLDSAKREGYYKSVNLKYNKQIICRKDI